MNLDFNFRILILFSEVKY